MSADEGLVAHHEGGHVVVAWKLGVGLKIATIKPRAGHSIGHVHHNRIFRSGDLEWDDSPQAKMRAERAILVALAGPFAQKRFAPRSRWRSMNFTGTTRGGADFDRVYDLIGRLHGGDVGYRYARYMEAWAEQLVERYWHEIEFVAQRLIERETLTGDEIRDAICAVNGWKPVTGEWDVGLVKVPRGQMNKQPNRRSRRSRQGAAKIAPARDIATS